MDKVSRAARSKIMSKIRSRGNFSTERRLRAALARAGVKGWTMHHKAAAGTPDFFFAASQIAIFIDGCFWHGCPTCYRRPHSRRGYWDKKVTLNIRRDKKVNRRLKLKGFKVLRVWEHDVVAAPSIVAEKLASYRVGKPIPATKGTRSMEKRKRPKIAPPS